MWIWRCGLLTSGRANSAGLNMPVTEGTPSWDSRAPGGSRRRADFQSWRVYFALVFGAGFVLRPIRILWVVPRFGARTAELMEAPVMLVVTIVAARWMVWRLSVASTPSSRLGMGYVAHCLLPVEDFTLVLWPRGLSINQYPASRDPVSGTVYYLMLALFAIMPLLVSRR